MNINNINTNNAININNYSDDNCNRSCKKKVNLIGIGIGIGITITTLALLIVIILINNLSIAN